MTIAVSINNISKMYRLGQIGTGTLAHDLNQFWCKMRGRPDPYTKLGDLNDRTQTGGDYVWALKGVDLQVEKGEILGIIGGNGAGKSTLLKLLSRVTAPTTGEIKIRGRMASLLEVGTGFHPELTGRENIFLNGAILGMTKPEIKQRIDQIVEFSGCAKYVDTPVKRYSSGMMVRLGFAIAAHLECEILIVDEVLAVGDVQFQRKCIGKLQELGSSSGRTVLFVSHNMASVAQLCERAVLMHQGQLIQDGSVGGVIQKYYELAAAGNQKLNEVGNSAIRSVKLLRNGEPSDYVCMGDEISFQIEYSFHEPVVAPRFGIGISTDLGVRIASSGTQWTDLSLGTLRGDGKISCNLGALPLNAGNYYLKVVLADQGGDSIDQREIALRFRVEPMDVLGTGKLPAPTQGVVVWPSNWELQERRETLFS